MVDWKGAVRKIERVIQRRQDSKIRRRTLRLTPVVIGICLMMVLASTHTLTTWPAKTSGNSSLTTLSTPTHSYPSGAAPVSNCFGGGTCTGSQGTSAGSGTTCVISFTETAGDFLYVAINYGAESNGGSGSLITSVSDGGVDAFTYIGGEFATEQSVALYAVDSEHGGGVVITVSLSTTEFGDCRVGQLPMGTMVGVVGAGGTTDNVPDTTLSVSNSATHEPSLLLAMFGSTRPSGPWSQSTPSGSWITGGDTLTGYNPGTNSELLGYNDTSPGTVTFTQALQDTSQWGPIYLSGIVVEFYFAGLTASNCFGGGTCTGSQGTSAGSGTTCVISFTEIAGDFLYVAINYGAEPNGGGGSLIASVTDGFGETFTYAGGEFATEQSVALYDVAVEHGGMTSITVALNATEFGTCRAGQLNPDTAVVVGPGATTYSAADTSLTVTNSATIGRPSLLLALFGSTRPSGAWTESSNPSGSWTAGAYQETGYNPGTNSEVYGYNDSALGSASFTVTLGDTGAWGNIYLSGIVAAFYGATSVYTATGWPGYDGPQAIYMTTDPYTTKIPLEFPSGGSAFQPASVNGVANSVAVGMVTGNPNVPYTYSYSYYDYSGSALNIELIWAGAGISQVYVDNNGDLWYTEDIELTASVTGNSGGNSPPSGTLSQINYAYDVGVNSTATGNNPGSEPYGPSSWLGATVGYAFEIAAALALETDGTSLAIATIGYLIGLLIDAGTETAGHSPQGNTQGGSPTQEWFETNGGSLGSCPYPCSSSTSGGQDKFSAIDQVDIAIPGPFNDGMYDINIGAANQIGMWEDDVDGLCYPNNPAPSTSTCGDAPDSYAGASATASITTLEAYGLGGYVDTASGSAAPGATVTLTQYIGDVLGTNFYSDFLNTTDSAGSNYPGYWNFFGDPGVPYTYQACLASSCSVIGSTASLDGSSYVGTYNNVDISL